MEHVRAPGYPVPRVRLADSTPTELVLRRLSGPTMVQACLAGSLDADQAGATVADLLRRLHTIPARHSAEPGHRVLHLDLHPDNVMLTPDGPQVLIVKGPLSPVRAAGFGRSADDRHRVDLHQDSLPDEPRHDCRTSGER
jgi:aminoglycoside phosphotransferase (APT) family kinase protein